MQLIKPMPLLLIVGLCLSMAGGCKMLTPPGLNNSGQSVSIKRNRPSRKHKPKNLNDKRAIARAANERGVTNHLDAPELANADQSIGLDDVSLEKSTVHVDADMDIESIEGEADEQLPTIIESAVHPFTGIKQSFTFSDQASPNNSKPTDSEAANANSQSSNQIRSDDIARQIENGEEKPDRLSEHPNAAPLDSQLKLEVNTNNQPMMRMVAQTDSLDSKDRATLKTDRLFSQSGPPSTPTIERNISVAPPALDEGVQAAGLENPEGIPSSEIIQNTALETPGHPSAELPDATDKPPTTNFAKHITESPPSEITSKATPVKTDTYVSSSPPSQTNRESALSWNQQVLAAIDRLEAEARAMGKPLDVNEQARVELLRLVAGDRNSAEMVFQGQDVKLQQFWQHQLAAIDEMLAPLPEGASSQAAAVAEQRKNMTNASAHLEKAQSQLADLATLTVAKCAFASEVRGFGQFTELTPAFEPGQQVLLYSELENYSLREGEVAGQPQLIAELQGQFSIIDEMNRVVYQYQYQPVQDYSQRRRNDFYMFFPITMPDLPIGKYRLHLQVDDLVGNKFASYRESMVFTMQGRTRRPVPQVTNSRLPRRFARPETATVPNMAKMMAADAAKTKQQQENQSAENQPPARLPLTEAENPPLPLKMTNATQGAVPAEQTLPGESPGTARSANNNSASPTQIPAGEKRR